MSIAEGVDKKNVVDYTRDFSAAVRSNEPDVHAAAWMPYKNSKKQNDNTEYPYVN